jgi:hypothetical protein
MDLLSTTALVVSVGYTQRIAGRQDFKKEMATKIARGEMTPQELVEEIVVMAEDIQRSAMEAKNAEMEVQRLLEETRAIERRWELPSAQESSLVEFQLIEEEEKVSMTIVPEEVVEKTEALSIPIFAIAQDVSNEMNILDNELDTSLDEVLSDYEHVKSDNKRSSFQAIAEDIINGVGNINTITIDHDDTNLIADALLATPPTIREKHDSSLNELDALKLAQEALASASENAIVDSQTVDEVAFVSPVPPSTEPPIDVVKSSMEIETSEIQQPITIDMNHSTGYIRSSPLARLLCIELGVDLADVQGTGLKGRVIADDVKKYAAAMQA